MKNRTLHHHKALPLLAVALAALCLIEGPRRPVQAGDHPTLMVHSVAVMPFFKGKKPSPSMSVLDIKASMLGTDEEVMPGAEAVLTQTVQQALEKRLGDAMVSREEVARAYDRIIAEHPDLTPRDQVLALAEALGVTYIMAGNVWRFAERQGNALAVGRPATMGFKLHLIHIPERSRIWADACDKTQQSLSENLFKASDFIKQKGRWVTVGELARIAVDDMVKGLPF
ncbi:hypothetical protein JCM14469_20070 [Desulfatiferula olefinivorans]